jgi:O-antigen ligase
MISVAILAAGSALIHPWAAPAVVAAAGCLVLVWLCPRRVYLILLVIAPFSVEFAAGGGTKIDFPIEVVLPALILVLVTETLRTGRVSVLKSRLWWPVLVFALYFALTLPGARFLLSAVKATLRDWTHLIGGFVLPLVLIRDRVDVKRLLRWAGISTAVLVVYGLFTQLLQGVAIYQAIGWPFFHEHTMPAAVMSLLACLALGLIVSGYAGTWWIRFVYLPLLVFAIALSFVRGAWIAFLAGVLAILWIYRRRIPLTLLAASALALVLLAVSIAGLGVGDLFAQRIEHFTDMEFVANVDRLDRWGSAVSIWWENPFFGTGWGTYDDEYFDHIFIPWAYSTGQRMGAHNLYLQTMAEGGLVGLGLFLSVIWVFYREAFRVFGKVRGDPLSEGLCAGAIAAASAHFLHAVVNNLGPSAKMALLFWFILALVPIAEHLWEQRFPAGE